MISICLIGADRNRRKWSVTNLDPTISLSFFKFAYVSIYSMSLRSMVKSALRVRSMAKGAHPSRLPSQVSRFSGFLATETIIVLIVSIHINIFMGFFCVCYFRRAPPVLTTNRRSRPPTLCSIFAYRVRPRVNVRCLQQLSLYVSQRSPDLSSNLPKAATLSLPALS